MNQRHRLEPTITEELTAVIGPALVAQLICDFGGREIYVPKAPGQHHPLTVSIGAEAALLLIRAGFAGINLKLPLPRDKAQRILALHESGKRRRDIARDVRCTERWVYRVLADHSAARQPAPPSLFP